MSGRLTIFLIILVFSCRSKDADWPTLDFGYFQLKAPKEWKKIDGKGADTYLGGLTNGNDTLWFLYGRYFSGPDENESTKHLYGQDTINGYSAVVVLPKKDSTGIMQMYIPKVKENTRFALSGYDIKEPETVLEIFKSVTFPNSDITKNSELTYSRFKEYPYGSGWMLYRAYCTVCHAQDKIMEGPTIESLTEGRDVDWVYKFLTNRQSVASDPLYQARLEMFNAHCMEFDNLSKHDVEQIVGYIKGQ